MAENKTLLELKAIIEMMMEEQKQLVEEIRDLKQQQKKIHDELKINSFALNSISIRNETIN